MIPVLALCGALFAQNLPPVKPLELPPRIGVMGTVDLSLKETVQRVLASDRDLVISRIAREEAVYSVRGAQGVYDPRLGANLFRQRSITPITSLIGGGPNGSLTQGQITADPQLSGLIPFSGGNYKIDFSSSRQSTNSTFTTVNPQFPSSINLTLNQPLWRGLLYDDNRHRLQVARKNVELTDSQLRQRVTDVVTQAVQAYWELDYAYRYLQVQIEAVGLAEQQDASNRRQLEQGLLAQVDVVATQTQVATFQQNVYLAQQAVTQAENALKILMLPDRNDPLWGMALVPKERPEASADLPKLDDALRYALASRPELKQSEIALQINRLDLKLSTELTRPQVDAYATVSAVGLSGHSLAPGPNPLTAGTVALTNQVNQLSVLAGLPPVPATSLGGVPPGLVGGYGQSLSNLTSGSFTTSQVGVQMSFPLRNRAALAQEAISTAEGRRLKTLRQQIEMAVEQEVRNTLQSAASARARHEAAISARQNAELQYTSEQRQFQAGTSTVFLVLQRQTDLIAARTREVRALADLGEAAAALDRATARTIDTQQIQIANP